MHEHHRNMTEAVGTYHEKPVVEVFLPKKFEITGAETGDLRVPDGRALQRHLRRPIRPASVDAREQIVQRQL